MKVSELAKEFNTTNKVILEKLTTLKLKAKGGNQELNRAVVIVLRSELNKESRSRKDGASSDRQKTSRKEEKPVRSIKETPKTKKTAPEIEKVLKDSKGKGKPDKEVKVKKVKKKTSDDEKKSEDKKVSSKTKRIVKKKAPPEEKEEKKATHKKKIPKAKTSSADSKAPVKKDSVLSVKPSPRPKPKISSEPFIPLKPLQKKKRRTIGRDGRESDKVSQKGDSLYPSRQQGGLSVLSDEQKSAGPLEPGSLQTEGDKNLEALEIKAPISVKEFSVRIQQKSSVVLKKLMQMGILAHINQNMGEEIVRRVAREFGYNLTKVKTQEQQLIERHKAEDDDPSLLTPRAPVVTFMGHVDHGKTSLLDRIRKSRIADKEHGGITQHIGASCVFLPKGKITFLDTPGHEAFTSMRARGAHITDLVVLVVAADEGIMPQTEEAIDHARAAGVPIVVALNKIDRRNADVDRVKKQLAGKDLNPEDWGGKTIVAGVSAMTGEGVDHLLEMILLEAELLELKANQKKSASGIVVEAHLSGGKGAVASLIVQGGTLCLNDIVVVGPYYGKVKAMFDDLELPIEEAGPSTPVEILGIPGVPEAGEMFYVVGDEKYAKEITSLRQQQLKDRKLYSNQKITLEDLYTQIQEGKIKELNVIAKADVQGSLEALRDSLEKIPSDEVKVKFIHTGVGDVNASDVILAVASNAIIIGFHIGIGQRAKEELEKQEVDVRLYRIIYDAVNDVRKALEGLLEPKRRKKFLSRIEVRQVFKLTKAGMVAGCYVVKGKVPRKAQVDVIRNEEVIHTGAISSLKRFKDDVRDVAEGYECGISLESFDSLQPGDIIEAYELETIARTL